MRRAKWRKTVFHLLTWLVILSQVTSSAAYADIKYLNKVNTLATPSIFQKSSPTEGSEEFRKSVLSDIKLLSVAFFIASHFLIDNRDKGTLIRDVRDELRNNAEYLKGNGIALEDVGWDERLETVSIPFARNGEKYTMRICPKEKLESLDKSDSEWAVSARFGIQVIGGEPLIGHGFTIEEVNKAPITPWKESEAMKRVLEELETVIRARAPDALRQKLLNTLEDFKLGKDGKMLGTSPAVYKDHDNYYLAFGTPQAMAIAPEFLNLNNPLSKGNVETLFHELYHAMASAAANGESIEYDKKTHIEAMRLAAQLFWGLSQKEIENLPLDRLKKHSMNALGDEIRLWKREQERIRQAMLNDNVKYLVTELKAALNLYREKRDDSKLISLFRLCNNIANEKPMHPIESRYPILRAVALLSQEEHSALLEILKDPRNQEVRRTSVVVGSILLMLDKEIPEDWMDMWAPHLKGRNIWQIATEIWCPGGGLSRVSQYHAIAMRELLKDPAMKLGTVEPLYWWRLDSNKRAVPAGLDYYASLPSGIKDLREVRRFPVKIGVVDTCAIIYHGVNKYGIDVWLISDTGKSGGERGDTPYYTKMMYNYNTKDNPVTWQEFSAFFSMASAELVRWKENERLKENPEQWRGPVVHTNDAQASLLDLYAQFLLERYPDDIVLKFMEMPFSTHTYPNREIRWNIRGEEMLRDMGIPERYWEYFRRDWDWDPKYDITSGRIRRNHDRGQWTGGVSAEHVDDVAPFDKWGPWRDLELVAVTNGDYRAFTAEKFRAIMSRLYPETDVEYPEAPQILKIKIEAKRDLGLNPDQYVVSYSGRLVPEKVGLRVGPDNRYMVERAFKEKNIEELVRMGIQVVIYGNVQDTEDSHRIENKLNVLEADLDEKRRNHPAEYPGRFIFVPRFDLEDQKALLAATDIQIQDSDEQTEAAGYTESDIGACGGLELAPPWREGMLQAQGVRINLDVGGEGNTLIPEDDKAESYLKILKAVLAKTPMELAAYQATAVRVNRVLEARLTAAEYLRQFSKAITKREKRWQPEQAPDALPQSKGSPKECLKAFYYNFKDGPVTVKKLMESRGKSETTVRKELEMLIALDLVAIDNSREPYNYRLPEEIRNLSPPQLEEILSIPELNLYEIPPHKIPSIKKKVAHLIFSFKYPHVSYGRKIPSLEIEFSQEAQSLQRSLNQAAQKYKGPSVVIYRAVSENIFERVKQHGFEQVPDKAVLDRIEKSSFVWVDDYAVHRGRLPFAGRFSSSRLMRAFQGKGTMISSEIPADLLLDERVLILDRDAIDYLNKLKDKMGKRSKSSTALFMDRDSDAVKLLMKMVTDVSDKNKEELKKILAESPEAAQEFVTSKEEIIMPADLMNIFLDRSREIPIHRDPSYIRFTDISYDMNPVHTPHFWPAIQDKLHAFIEASGHRDAPVSIWRDDRFELSVLHDRKWGNIEVMVTDRHISGERNNMLNLYMRGPRNPYGPTDMSMISLWWEKYPAPEDLMQALKRFRDSGGNPLQYEIRLIVDLAQIYLDHHSERPADILKRTKEDMSFLHDLNLELLPPIERGKTLLHIIPVSLVPQDPRYNQRAKFIEFVHSLNRRYPNATEKIKVVTERQMKDLRKIIAYEMEHGAIVDVALDNENYIDELPDGVKALVFESKDGNMGDFRQLEGILASLRALHIEDRSQREDKLSMLYRLLTGEEPPNDIPDINDTREFARRFKFILPPMTIKNKEELRQLNENLLRLIEAA